MDTLDIKDPEILYIIEMIYNKKAEEVKENAEKEGERLINSVEYYQTHSLDRIIKDIKINAKERYLNLDDETALTEAVIENLQHRGKFFADEVMAKQIIAKMDPKKIPQIVNKYKKSHYEDMVNIETMKAEDSISVYKDMNETDKIEYASLYQEMCLAKGLFHAKEEAIKETAKDFKAELPLCITNQNALDKESNKIVNFYDKDENDKSIVEKIKEKNKKINDEIHKNFKEVVLGASFSNVIGLVFGTGRIITGGSYAEGLATTFITAGCVMAALASVYNSDEIRGYFKDKKSIKEAKDLGLLDLLVNWGNTSKALNKFTEKIRKPEELVTDFGGNNGLHK